MQDSSPNFLFALLGLGVVLVGCLLFYLARRTKRVAARSLAWPKASGTITRSDVMQRTKSGGENTGTTTVYQPAVAYRYEVAGAPYTGGRIRAGSTEFGTLKAAQKLRDVYPVGRVVEVAYDPTQPDSAMLEPGNAAGSGGLLIMGVVFLILGALAIVVAL